jgi:hypothetical protein
MCCVPEHKTKNKPPKNPIQPDPPKKLPNPIWNNCAGLHHETPNQRRKWYHTDNNQPWLFEGGTILPLQRDHHRGRSSRTIRKTCVPTLQNSPQSHLWLRPPIYQTIHDHPLCKTRDQKKPEHGVSSTDQWTVRTNQPVAGTIPQNIRELLPKQLGKLAPPSPICP